MTYAPDCNTCCHRIVAKHSLLSLSRRNGKRVGLKRISVMFQTIRMVHTVRTIYLMPDLIAPAYRHDAGRMVGQCEAGADE
jgi:hypothetical protein